MTTNALKTIVITGGAGFVGSNLAYYLADRGHRIVVMDNLVRRGSERNLPSLRDRGITFQHGDIRCREDFDSLPANADVLIECSAQPNVVDGFANPRFDIQNNLHGTLECLEFCRRIGAGMIYFSSNRVYSASRLNALPHAEGQTRFDYQAGDGNPVAGFDVDHGISHNFTMDGGHRSIYGVSKAAADLLCQEWASAFDLKVVINRLGVIAGEGQFGMQAQGWVTYWVLAGVLERPLTYFGYNGKQVRDILFIEDVCRLIDIEIAQLSDLGGRVFNAGGGRANSLSLREATALLEELLQTRMAVSTQPKPRQDDLKLYLTDNRAIQDAIGWQPEVGLTAGLESIIRWVRDNGIELRRCYL
ncbi:MAG: NAD-dependent epimerase/dehydratase family protein [Desulfobacterales bacterium]|nr:NAD-dependent epimerase/dehydratase family protein [Desulfobacterales bacterium]